MRKADQPLTYSRQGPLLVHAHANGYPPQAYREFLRPFQDHYQVQAIFLRPFWSGTDPEALTDWFIFREDYLRQVLELLRENTSGSNQLIGVGHSLGAITTLMAAIKAPEHFQALVLIEPSLFPGLQGFVMRTLAPLGIFRHIHPLMRRTLRRKTSFPDRETMFRNYRGKEIFRRIPDPVLWDYVDGLGEQKPDGSLTLRYRPSWEVKIYETGGSVERHIFKNLDRVSCPVLVLRGEESDTIGPGVVKKIERGLPVGKGVNVPGWGHLLPLEAPKQTARIVLDFLNSAGV